MSEEEVVTYNRYAEVHCDRSDCKHNRNKHCTLEYSDARFFYCLDVSAKKRAWTQKELIELEEHLDECFKPEQYNRSENERTKVIKMNSKKDCERTDCTHNINATHCELENPDANPLYCLDFEKITD